MYTSYWGQLQKIQESDSLCPICISRGYPKWIPVNSVPRVLELAPEWSWLKLDRVAYEKLFMERLSRLNAENLWDRLDWIARSNGSETPVLLCWEKPPFTVDHWCHRRLVSQWFEMELNVHVPELSFENPISLLF